MNSLKRYWWVIGLFLALALVLLAPLASSHPDGLERVAEDEGFIDQAEDASYEIIPDYAFPGIKNANSATIVGGLFGALLIFGLVYGLAWLLRRRSQGQTLDT